MAKRDGDSLPTPKRAVPAERSLSNSERQLFTTCRKKWFWSYEKRYGPVNTPTPFLVGTAVHNCLAAFYSKEGLDEDEANKIINAEFKPVISGKDGRFLDPDQIEDVVKQEVMTQGMVRAYLKVYADDKKKWKVLEINGEPAIELKAKFRVNQRWEMYFTVDMVVTWKKKVWIVEHKTAGAIDSSYVSRLALDDQISTYLVGARKTWGIKPAGVIYNVMMKPRIRQKQKESRSQYLDRVMALYEENPQEYLYRANVLRSADDQELFEKELDLFTQEMDRAEETGFYYKNTNACAVRGVCPMMALCIEGEDQAKDRYKVKKARSQYDEEDE